MPDYQKFYTTLFNAITDALEELRKQNYGLAAERLMHAQLATETLYMKSGGPRAESAVEKERGI